jgi:peptidoglycan/LPS O-acetylase OafA/YrhL
LVHAALTLEASKSSRLLAFLGSNVAVGLGHFSYSLYLTHLPVLALVHFALDGLALSPHVHALGLLALGTPASVAFAWLFYWAVERHCIGQPPSLTALARALRPGAARAQEGVARK